MVNYQGYEIPSGSDRAQGPLAFKKFADSLENKIIKPFNDLLTRYNVVDPGIRWQGNENVLAGAKPPKGAPIYIFSGVITNKTEWSGGLLVPFPQPFPNGLVSFTYHILSGGAQFDGMYEPGVTLGGFYGVVVGADFKSVGGDKTVKVSYQAMGW